MIGHVCVQIFKLDSWKIGLVLREKLLEQKSAWQKLSYDVGWFKKIECKKVKDEIKEGYQIIFFLNCRWVGFKSPKLVQWKPNAMLIWNILSVHWMFECVGGLQYLRSLKWEQKKKRASVARIVTKYVWPPQPNLKTSNVPFFSSSSFW